MIERSNSCRPKKELFSCLTAQENTWTADVKLLLTQIYQHITCAHCSEDCLVNQASRLACTKGYDIYIVPGGSCIPKILKTPNYEGIVGVACGEEIKMFSPFLKHYRSCRSSYTLIKNGCANTVSTWKH